MDKPMQTLVRACAALALALIVGCSSDDAQDTNQSASQSQPASMPTRRSMPTPTPVPDRTAIAQLVTRFFADVDQSAEAKKNDLSTLLSAAFLSAHDPTWSRDYGSIRNANVSVIAVRSVAADFAIDYHVDYDYMANTGMILHWRREGTWVAAYSANGWGLNEDKWNSVRITGVTTPNGTHFNVDDTTFADGHHTFILVGLLWSFTAATNGDWRIAPVGVAAQATPSYTTVKLSNGSTVTVHPGESYTLPNGSRVEIAPNGSRVSVIPPPLRYYSYRQPQLFHGYFCTVDCSGHIAGYNWAIEHGLSDPYECPIDPHNSRSFTEGCWAATGREGPGPP